MADDDLLEKVHSLSDLELAVLLCLVNREHVLISTPPAAIDDLVQELQLIASKTYSLQSVVVNCHPSTTLEDFASALLLQPQHTPLNSTAGSISPFARTDSYFALSSHSNHRSSTPLSPRTFPLSPQMAHFVIAKNLDRAPRVVQIQALELLRTRRIFTRTSVQAAPKQFVFIPVLGAASGGEAHVTAHLNDFFAVAHWHNPEDGYVNLDEAEDRNNGDDETASTESVVKKASNDTTPSTALISDIEISQLAKLSQEVQIDIDILRYQMNIIAFLRMHRAVAGGITPAATKHLHQLVKSLAPLHKLDFVTPALIGLAVKKVFLHRIRITEPEKERSMQWGSQLEAVEALLEDVGPEEVMEEVLEMVTAPL
ncbi:uncharacterized protein TRIVIDRAFT_82240 [Trichoderma virens Gv29-8]|uniref:magnesium chelatase n=1 Tax=Hypocrea virens (strain Gv29-8 / FGSC 10586) TaxID=413071 RepID=G9MH96_HYPVG|nr:uncharacterized protein TRIVIDRAFT_82240 [Trichoderma virens Gv29-8]EHK26084.1 hypothetical protein TRIVIDRAFT_82240 [Trichoderma virens Gv29-8]